MRLLILGGTAFLGRALVRAALERDIDITCLARGTSPAPPGAAFVTADRDADNAYAAVADRTWDAVIDLARQPGHARRAADQIRARHWLLVSTANVYAQFDQPEQDERSALLEPLAGEVMADMEDYGAAKVACEDAVRASGRSWTIIRPGLIGGAGDTSGRSGYYPWRFAHPTGADVLVPPDLTFPVALIDVEDLARWAIHCAEHGVCGVFNATGPTTTLSDVLATAREVAASTATPRPVPAETLAGAGITHWMGPRSLPLWIDDPAWRWFSTLDTAAARRHGLSLRPLRDTLAAALAYEETRTDPRQAGLTDEGERFLRELLH